MNFGGHIQSMTSLVQSHGEVIENVNLSMTFSCLTGRLLSSQHRVQAPT